MSLPLIAKIGIAIGGALALNEVSKAQGTGSNTNANAKLSAYALKKLAFLNWLNQYVQSQKDHPYGDQPFNDMGYVRTADHFNAFGVVQYMAAEYTWGGKRISKGNYTDMTAWIKMWAQRSNAINGVTEADMDIIINNYFVQAGLDNTLGRNGPHSSYLSSLMSHIDVGNVLHLLTMAGGTVAGIIATVGSGGTLAPVAIPAVTALIGSIA